MLMPSSFIEHHPVFPEIKESLFGEYNQHYVTNLPPPYYFISEFLVNSKNLYALSQNSLIFKRMCVFFYLLLLLVVVFLV